MSKRVDRHGANRNVVLYDEYVIKTNRKATHGCSKEWKNWEKYKEGYIGTWLCPCLSFDGKELKMKRAEELGECHVYVPSCFTDVKNVNMGVVDGRVVMIDYETIKKREGHKWIRISLPKHRK